MENDTVSLLVVILFIIFIVFIFIKIAIRLRNNGGSLTTTMVGSTYEFLNKDKREASEEIVQMNAGKNLDEQRSSEQKKSG